MFKVKRVRKKCLACRQGLSDVQILCDDIPPEEVELLRDMVLLHCLRCAREKVHANQGQPPWFMSAGLVRVK